MAIFHGGVHPHDYKLSADSPICAAPLPASLVVPLSQHIGIPAKPVVKKGDRVKRGQLLGEAVGVLSANVHCPTSGEITDIDTITNQAGQSVPAVFIAADGLDVWDESCNREVAEDTKFAPNEIIETARWAGIVGMGGAMFPLSVKLSPPPLKKIHTLIINAAECEPFLTADYRLLCEEPRKIWQGIFALKIALSAEKIIVAFEANKQVALANFLELKNSAAALVSAADATNVEIKIFPTVYPQGSERQIVPACIGKEIPRGGLPMDLGVCVDNVGTAFALSEALYFRRPLIERITTVSGNAVKSPKNFRVRLGTSAKLLLDECGFDQSATEKIIYGGPMMGFAHFSPDLPIIKGNNGVLAFRNQNDDAVNGPCLRCGKCIDVCPSRLSPEQFGLLAENSRYLDAAEFAVGDCIECGCCAYICPARRSLVQWIRVCKAEIAAAKKHSANRSR